MNTEQNPEQQESHLFSENELMELESATRWQRFLNFLIDNVFMNLGLSFVTQPFSGRLLRWQGRGSVTSTVE